MKKIYSVLFVVTAIVLFSYIFISTGRISRPVKGNIRSFTDGWTGESGETVSIINTFPKYFGHDFTLEKTLPGDIIENDAFCFETRNCNIYIYVDDKLIYTFEARENYTGRGYGYCFHEVSLDPSYSGHVIKVRIKTVYGSYSGILNAYIGQTEDYIHMSILSRTLSAAVSVAIIFMGLLMIGIYFSIPDKENMPFNILSFGASAIVIGTFMMLDANILQLLFGREYLWRGLHRSVLLFALYPCVSYFNSFTKLKRNIYLHVAFVFNILVIAGVLISRFAFGVDMALTFIISAGIMLVGVLIIMIVIFIDDTGYCKKEGVDAGIKKYYPGMITFVICGLADVIMYAMGIQIRDSYANFSRFGFAFLVILSMLQFLRWWTRDRADIERERFINRTLQYAMSSGSPEEGIKSMLDYMGRELKAKRICVFEDQGNGKYRGTYEWYTDGVKSADIGLIYLPYDGFVDDLYKLFKANGGHLIADDPEIYKTSSPGFYNFSKQYDISNMVAGPLETGGSLKGYLAFFDSPPEFLEEISHIINIVSYFINQLIIQRQEQARLRSYSYNDALSGALNRRAFNEYLQDVFDPSQPFGFMICHINGFDETNRKLGYEEGDKLIINTVKVLTDVFSKENIYRLGGAEFAVFGHETDEAFFKADVTRVKDLTAARDISLAMGSVFCAFGTMDIKKVIKHVNELLRKDM